MAKEPITVVITGAAGQIGYSLIYMISSGYVFGADQPLVLNLLDIEPAMGVLGGVCMEIDDCAFPLVKKVNPTADPNVAFKVRPDQTIYFKAITGGSTSTSIPGFFGHFCGNESKSFAGKLILGKIFGSFQTFMT